MFFQAANVIILSCDLITDFPLSKLLEFHSVKRAALTCLMTTGTPSESVPPGLKVKKAKSNKKYKYIIKMLLDS